MCIYREKKKREGEGKKYSYIFYTGMPLGLCGFREAVGNINLLN